VIKVITTVQFIVDFIGARGFQLQNFLRKEREGDVIYCCDGRWCGRAEVLKRIAELYDVIEEFTTSKNEPILDLTTAKAPQVLHSLLTFFASDDHESETLTVGSRSIQLHM